MTSDFFVHDRRAADYTMVTIGGELDLATAPALNAHLSDLMANGRARLVLDLAPLEFVDAYGLGVLAGMPGRLRERGGWLRLVNVHPRIRRLLGITRLTDALPVYASIAQALGATPSGPLRPRRSARRRGTGRSGPGPKRPRSYRHHHRDSPPARLRPRGRNRSRRLFRSDPSVRRRTACGHPAKGPA